MNESPNQLSNGSEPPVTLRALFPTIMDEELDSVADTLHGYCATVLRIYERLQREHPEMIDDLMQNRRMKGKVDS